MPRSGVPPVDLQSAASIETAELVEQPVAVELSGERLWGASTAAAGCCSLWARPTRLFALLQRLVGEFADRIGHSADRRPEP